MKVTETLLIVTVHLNILALAGVPRVLADESAESNCAQKDKKHDAEKVGPHCLCLKNELYPLFTNPDYSIYDGDRHEEECPHNPCDDPAAVQAIDLKGMDPQDCWGECTTSLVVKGKKLKDPPILLKKPVAADYDHLKKLLPKGRADTLTTHIISFEPFDGAEYVKAIVFLVRLKDAAGGKRDRLVAYGFQCVESAATEFDVTHRYVEQDENHPDIYYVSPGSVKFGVWTTRGAARPRKDEK